MTDKTPMPIGFDTERFHHLARMMGANLPELLHHAINDLDTARRGLAAPSPTLAAIREHTHVLSALAGTLGDPHLQALAEELNRDAHAGTVGDVAGAVGGIDALITFLEAQKAVP